MNDFEHLSKEVERWGHALLMPLQTTKEINEDAFRRMNEAACELARQLKGSEMIPRRAIGCLYITASILTNEAEYSRAKERIMEMASAINQAFGAILEGKAVGDRPSPNPNVK